MLRNISVVLSANSTSFAAQMRTAAMGVRQFGDDAVDVATKTDSASRKTLDTVGKLSLALSAGLAVALGASVMVAAQFEKEMRNVASISPSVQRNFEKISDSIVDMSREMPQSAKVLAKGLYDITSSGFDGAEAMTILKSSALAASAGLTDTATSARAITAVLNAYGMEASEAGYVSDVLFGTVVKGVVNFEDLAGVIGDTVGSAAAAGVEIDELGAAVATMTLSGISAAEAGTSLNRVIQSFIDPSEAMIGLLKTQGYESGVAALESLGLQGAMEMLRTTTGGNIETLVALFPEIRAARGALALMANDGQVASDVFGYLTDKTQVLGATQAAYTEQSKSFSFQLELAKNNASALGIELGTALLPALSSLLQIITGVFQGFSDLPGPMKVAAATLAGLTAIVGAVGGAFLLLAPRIAAAQTVMASMAVSSPALAGGLGMAGRAAAGLGIAMAALTIYLAANAKEKANAKAETERLVTALQSEAQGQKGATDAAIAGELARRGLIKTAKELGVNLNDLAAAARGDEEAMGRVITQTVKAGGVYENFAKGLKDVAGAHGRAKEQIDAEAEALARANPQLAEQKEKLAEVERILGPVADGLGLVGKKTDELTDIQKTYNDSMKEFADGGSVYKSVLSEIQEAQQTENEQAIAGIDKRIEAVRKSKDLSEEAKDSQIAGLEEQKAALQDFTASAEISLGQYNAGLQKQIDAAKEWSANYVAIYREFGPQVATILASMGEEGRIIAAKMTADLEGEGKKTAELLPQLYGQAAVGATQNLFIGLEPSSPNTRRQVKAVSDAVTEVLSPLPGWTGDTARLMTQYLATQLDPAIPRTGEQAEAAAEAFRSKMAGLPGWTEGKARAIQELLAAGLDPMIGKTGQTAEETAEALRSRLSGLPGWTQGAGGETVDNWLVALGRGTGGTGAETAAWARALVAVLNEILRGVGGNPIEGDYYRQLENAEGNVWAPRGGREDHQAQIAPAGAWRVWAEDETGGEAYIPLAPGKRKRSMGILRDVADRFGMGLVQFAYGGVTDDLGLPMPPTAEGWGHMLGRSNAEADGFTYQQAREWKRKADEAAAAAAAQGSGGGLAGSSDGLDPEFLSRFNNWNASLGNILSINSGFRSRAEQQRLYDMYLAGTGNLAAPPGSSNHERGLAIDHSPSGGDINASAGQFKLHHPVGGEPWHVEPFAGGGFHMDTYDKGGILWPGYTMAYNGTGLPERVLTAEQGGIYPSTYTGMGMNTGNFLARTAYRLTTGERAVYDDNLNGRPDAWDNGAPPGMSIGMGLGGGAGTSNIDASVNVSPGAIGVEVRVSPGANTSAVEEAVRRALGPALQELTARLTRQVRARIAV